MNNTGYDFWTLVNYAYTAFVLIGPVLMPLGLGIIAKKREGKVFPSILVGVLLGPVLAGVVLYLPFVFPLQGILQISMMCAGFATSMFGHASIVIAIFSRKQPRAEPGITLPIPLPPGTRDWGAIGKSDTVL